MRRRPQRRQAFGRSNLRLLLRAPSSLAQKQAPYRSPTWRLPLLLLLRLA